MFKFFSRYWSRFAVVTLAGEVLYLTAAVCLAIHIRFNRVSPEIFTEPLTWLRIVTFVTTICIGMYLNDLFEFHVYPSIRGLGLGLMRALVFTAVGLWGIYYVIPALFLGRGVLAIAFILAIVPLALWRLFFLRTLANQLFPERIILVGTDSAALKIANEILDRSHLGYQVLGFLDDDPELQGVNVVNLGVIGVTADALELALEKQATRIVVAQQDHRGKLDLDALLSCKTQGIKVDRGADFFERLTGQVSLDGPRVRSWLLFAEGFVVSRTQLLWKRILDLAVAICLLLLALPILPLVAIAVRLGSRGPILYRQERVGRQGQVFTLWKFRSMDTEAETESGPRWADQDDPRVTWVGRVIRKARLDELPQLWNVLRGDMSLVGPRPERPEFVDQLRERNPLYDLRLAVRPGLTGWAQIRASYAASFEESIEKLKYDLYYIKNLSVFLDLSILASTIRIVLLRRGAQ